MLPHHLVYTCLFLASVDECGSERVSIRYSEGIRYCRYVQEVVKQNENTYMVFVIPGLDFRLEQECMV